MKNQRKSLKSKQKERIEKETNELREEVSILVDLIRGVKVKSGILDRMKKKNKMKKSDDLAPLKETIKQKIQLKAPMMTQYEKRTKFYIQKNTFKTDKIKFYRKLGK